MVPCKFLFVRVLDSEHLQLVLVTDVHLTFQLLLLPVMDAVQRRQHMVTVAGSKSLQHDTQRRLVTELQLQLIMVVLTTQRHQLILSTRHVTVNMTHSNTSSSCQHDTSLST